jgi:hypothetical protein
MQLSIKTKVLLPQAEQALAEFKLCYIDPLVSLLPKIFNLFGFAIFRFGAYLMKIVQDTSRAHLI